MARKRPEAEHSGALIEQHSVRVHAVLLRRPMRGGKGVGEPAARNELDDGGSFPARVLVRHL